MPPRDPICREEGCEREAIDGQNFCTRHISQPRRCKKTRTIDGTVQRCKNFAMSGLQVCWNHGGAFPRERERSKQVEVLTKMQKFVRPWEGDLDPYIAFENELRRTMGRIAWYDEQIGALASSEDLIWGLTKEERVMASETPGVNRTYEARVNILEDLQRWERKHLLDMEKIWLQANLDEKRLTLMKSYVQLGYEKINEALVRLGIDTKNPDVRSVLADVFLSATAGPDLVGHAYQIEQVK
jgi:hypothetical protein